MRGFFDALEAALPDGPPASVLEVGRGRGRGDGPWSASGTPTPRRRRRPARPRPGGRLAARGLTAPVRRHRPPAVPGRRVRPRARRSRCSSTCPTPRGASPSSTGVCRGDLVVSVPREPVWRVANLARGKYLSRAREHAGHIQHWSRRRFAGLVASQLRRGHRPRARSPGRWSAPARGRPGRPAPAMTTVVDGTAVRAAPRPAATATAPPAEPPHVADPGRGSPATTRCWSWPPSPSASRCASRSASPTTPRPPTRPPTSARACRSWRATASSGTASPSCTSRRSCPFLLGPGERGVRRSPHRARSCSRVVSSTALVLPLALLARRIGGPDRGRRSRPGSPRSAPACRRAWSTGARAPRPSTCCSWPTAVWCVVSAADATGEPRAVRIGGAGLLVGLAYLTRPEGLFFALPLGLAVWSSGASRGAGAVRGRPRTRSSRWPSVRRPARCCASCRTPPTCTTTPARSSSAPRRRTPRSRPGTRSPRPTATSATACCGRSTRPVCTSPTPSARRCPSLAADDPGGYAAIVGTNVRRAGRGDRGPRVGPDAVLGAAARARCGCWPASAPGGPGARGPPASCWPAPRCRWPPRSPSSCSPATWW